MLNLVSEVPPVNMKIPTVPTVNVKTSMYISFREIPEVVPPSIPVRKTPEALPSAAQSRPARVPCFSRDLPHGVHQRS